MLNNEIIAVRTRAALMEAYAEIMETIQSRISWYQHEDDDGNLVDDDGENATIHLAAYREAAKQIKKLAGA